MSDKHSLIPDCFARFHDPAAVECQTCLDRIECKAKCRHNGSAEVTVPPERVHVVYPLGKRADVDDLREVLSQKTGQIARTLSQGNKVVLVVSHNQLQVLALNSTPSQEDNTMSKKPDTKSKKAVEDDDEDEDEATPAPKTVKGKDLKPTKAKAAPVVEDDDEDEDEEEEAPAKPAKKTAPAAKPAKKAAKVVEEDEDEDEDDLDLEDVDEEDEEDEDEEEEAPKSKKKKAEPVIPAKKPKKAAPTLNTAQSAFVDGLKTTYKDNDVLFKHAKKLGVKWTRKDDPRIDRMLCVMAVKAFLGTAEPAAAPAKKKK